MSGRRPRKIGRYEIIELIGEGAMGQVYKARDPNIDRVVAIKVIRSELVSQSPKFLERFRREAQAAGRLSHPNIVTVYDAGMEKDNSYIVMEYLEGRPLAEIIGDGLPPDRVIDLSIQICDALEYAHSQGLVHRDIKPENVMVLDDGRVKITDFGLARLASTPHLTQSGLISGTPSYMSPEQIQGQQLDGRTDIFSLGCVMYEMLTGQQPFPGDNIGTVLYRIMNEEPAPSEKLDTVAPQLLKSIILRALSKSRERRYQTCAEIGQDLRQCQLIGEAVGMIQPIAPPEVRRTAVFVEQAAVNPFTYGNPITDPMRFYGRQHEVEQIFSRLRNPAFESSSIVGERRVGKTSLLRVMAHPDVVRAQGLDPDRYIFVYNDLLMVGESTTPLQLWLRLLRTIRRQIQDPDPEMNDIIADMRASGVVDNYLLADFFDLLGDMGIHVVLLLDEFETITYNANFGPDFFGGLRSLAIHHDLALITSSRLELIDLCHSDEVRTSPFFNIFANVNLRGLTPTEVEALLDGSLEGTGVEFTAGERQAVVEVGGYHPFFTQVAAHFLWDAHDDGLAEGERIPYMRRHFEVESEPHFADYWQHSTDGERILLTALSLIGAISRRGESCQVVVEQALDRFESVLNRLEKRALVLSVEGRSVLFSPFFEDWVLKEVFDLLGTADAEFEAWRRDEGSRFAPQVIEILPQVAEEHRSWVGEWLSSSSGETFMRVVRRYLR